LPAPYSEAATNDAANRNLDAQVVTAKTSTQRGRYGRLLLGLGVFAALGSGILFVTHQVAPANSMAGMGGDGMKGHDMSGMSHDDMMQVDGAFNPIPVTIVAMHPFHNCLRIPLGLSSHLRSTFALGHCIER
jgi:hypothetical protein